MSDEKQIIERIAALNAVLAGATKACPHIRVVEHFDTVVDEEGLSSFIDKDRAHAGVAEGCPYGCQGTGEVAMFPDFRQECGYERKYQLPRDGPVGSRGYWQCPDCQAQAHLEQGMDRIPVWTGGTGWQVRAGGMAGALAGDYRGKGDVLWLLTHYLNCSRPESHLELEDEYVECETRVDTLSADTILAKTLELVIKIAGLEVSDA